MKDGIICLIGGIVVGALITTTVFVSIKERRKEEIKEKRNIDIQKKVNIIYDHLICEGGE